MKEIDVIVLKHILETHTDPSIDVIDVRTEEEYHEGHIPNVRNVPLASLQEHLTDLATKTHIYVHCRSGVRSSRAVEELTRLGVSGEIINVRGGMQAWEDAGFATVST